MKKYVPLFLIGLGIVLILFFLFRCTTLSCITINHLAPFTHQELYESTPKTFRALYTTKEGLFRIEKQAFISPGEAEMLTQATRITIQGLFSNAQSPYPGPLSDEIICDTTFIPNPDVQPTIDGNRTVFTAYANNRLQYGSCIEDQILYKGYIALFYCPNHASWYKAELLVPIKLAIEDAPFFHQLDAIRCR